MKMRVTVSPEWDLQGIVLNKNIASAWKYYVWNEEGNV